MDACCHAGRFGTLSGRRIRFGGMRVRRSHCLCHAGFVLAANQRLLDRSGAVAGGWWFRGNDWYFLQPTTSPQRYGVFIESKKTI